MMPYNLASRLLSSWEQSKAPIADKASPPCIQKLLNPRIAITPSAQFALFSSSDHVSSPVRTPQAGCQEP